MQSLIRFSAVAKILVVVAAVVGTVALQHATGWPQQVIGGLIAYWNQGNPTPLPEPVRVPEAPRPSVEAPQAIAVPPPASASGTPPGAPKTSGTPGHTPEQCFEAILKAQSQYDLTQFRKYVDLDAVLSDYAAFAITLDKEKPAKIGEMLSWGAEKAGGGDLKETLKQQLTDAIEINGSEGKWLLGGPLAGMPAEIVKEPGTYEFDKVEVLERHGKVAWVGLPLSFPQLDASVVLKYRLRDTGTHWQVAGIDLDGFAKEIEPIRQEALNRQNALIENSNMATMSLIQQALSLGTVTRQNIPHFLGRNSLVFSFTAHNLGPRDIQQFTGIIVCRNSSSGKLLKRVPFRINSPVPAGTETPCSFETKLGLLDTGLSIVYECPDAELGLSIEVYYLKFADGTELKRIERGRTDAKK